MPFLRCPFERRPIDGASHIEHRVIPVLDRRTWRSCIKLRLLLSKRFQRLRHLLVRDFAFIGLQ